VQAAVVKALPTMLDHHPRAEAARLDSFFRFSTVGRKSLHRRALMLRHLNRRLAGFGHVARRTAGSAVAKGESAQIRALQAFRRIFR
jgi:hypothetical protein